MNISVTPNNGYTFDKCTLPGGGVTNNSEFTNTSFHITKSNKKQILNFVFKADTLDTILTSIPTEGGKVTMEQISTIYQYRCTKNEGYIFDYFEYQLSESLPVRKGYNVSYNSTTKLYSFTGYFNKYNPNELLIKSTNSNYTISNNGGTQIGEQTTITCIPSEGFEFKFFSFYDSDWNELERITENPYTFTISPTKNIVGAFVQQ